jgi:hypothetical protein
LPCWLQSREEPSTTSLAVRLSRAKPRQTQTSTRVEEALATELSEGKGREDLGTRVMKWIELVLTGERRGEAEPWTCGDWRRGEAARIRDQQIRMGFNVAHAS